MKGVIIFILGIMPILSGCGISIPTTQLVDEWGGSYSSQAIHQFQDKEIYNDQTTDVWGLEQTNCKLFVRQDSLAFSGKSCISLTWNRTNNCPWIGMGIGWNGYAAKDLSSIMNTGSIDFYMRSIQGTQFIPTLIFLLEDYSGIQTAALLKAKHLTRYPINQEWQKVSIPLSNFLQASGQQSDYSNIKSLNIECQGEGALLIDHVEVGVAANGNYNSAKFGKTVVTDFPSFIFQEELPYAWGIGVYKGKSILISDQKAYRGNKSIHLKWNQAELGTQIKQFGINWAHWQAIGFPDSMINYELKLRINTTDSNAIKQLKLGFESYNGKVVFLPIQEKNINPIEGSDWLLISVPFQDFGFGTSGFSVDRFKQFLIEFDGSGEIWLDDISIQKR